MKRKTHKELIEIAFTRPGVRREYEKLGAEFSALNELLKARIKGTRKISPLQ